MADELRATAAPGMRGEGGRVQTAANPLEFAGAALQRYAGMRRGGAVEEAQRQMFEERLRRLREGMGAAGAP